MLGSCQQRSAELGFLPCSNMIGRQSWEEAPSPGHFLWRGSPRAGSEQRSARETPGLRSIHHATNVSTCSWPRPGTAGWPPTGYTAGCPAEAPMPGDQGPEHQGQTQGQQAQGVPAGIPGSENLPESRSPGRQAPVDPSSHREPGPAPAQPPLAETGTGLGCHTVPALSRSHALFLCFTQTPPSTFVPTYCATYA